MKQQDQRPAFVRLLWRDKTGEHWCYSLVVQVAAETIWLTTVLGALYMTRRWWLPWVASNICNGGQ